MKARIVGQMLVVAAALALASVRHADGQQAECTVVVVETPQTVRLDYGCHTVGATIETTVDSDLYSFTGEAGDVAWVVADQISDNCFGLQLVVFGPNGFQQSTLCQPNCVGPNVSCSLLLPLTLIDSGEYVIVVSDPFADQTGSYTLQVERISPAPDLPAVAYGVTSSGQLAPTTDQDYFPFHGEDGSLIEYRVDQTSNNCCGLQLQIFDPLGVLVLDMSCQPNCVGPNISCSLVGTLTLSVTGEYVAILSDPFRDQVGTYNVAINCILGCPPLTSVASRNAPPNLLCYRDVLSPAVGGTWCAEVDSTTNPGATVTVVLVCAQPFASPVPTPYGALLVNTATEVRCSLVALAPGEVVGRHSARIPDNVALVGRPFYTQGLSAGPGPRGSVRIELCNALDYVMGY